MDRQNVVVGRIDLVDDDELRIARGEGSRGREQLRPVEDLSRAERGERYTIVGWQQFAANSPSSWVEVGKWAESGILVLAGVARDQARAKLRPGPGCKESL